MVFGVLLVGRAYSTHFPLPLTGFPPVQMASDTDSKKGSEELLRLFPMIFTTMCGIVFMVPCFTLWYLSRQPALGYFESDHTWVIVLVPAIVLLAHLYHTRCGPQRYITPCALMIPSIILFVIGLTVNSGSSDFVQSLFSLDCDIVPQKAHLQLEWEAAHAFFKQCLSDTATRSNFTTQFLADTFRIQDCTEYPAVQAKHDKTWGYLQKLEENYACSGFCIPGPQLWSSGPHKDSCSVAVSMIFKYFVGARSEKIIIMMGIVFAMTLVFFAILGPTLKKNGFDW